MNNKLQLPNVLQKVQDIKIMANDTQLRTAINELQREFIRREVSLHPKRTKTSQKPNKQASLTHDDLYNMKTRKHEDIMKDDKKNIHQK